MPEVEVESSFCKWFSLDTQDITSLVDDVIKEYTKIQDISDGPMFPGELRNLILRVARTNSEGNLDVCDGSCLGYCKCKLPQPYSQE
jgi:hypothetical protein